MAILGLLNTEQFSSERFKNVRRSVLYFYPNGAAPLTGLLSMLKEEDSDDPEYSWYEKRLSTQSTETANNNGSVGPFADTSNVALSDPITIVANTVYRAAVDDASKFRVGHQVLFRGLDLTSGTGDLQGIVTQVFTATTPQRIEFRALAAPASTIKNGATDENVNKETFVIGSAFGQGTVDISTSIYNTPLSFTNYMQIFKSPFSISGTALKTSVKYDDTGAYKDLAKEVSVFHMIEMEKAFLFGDRSGPYADPDSGLPTYTTGGIIWHLKQWESATGGYNTTAATLDTDDNKRIIENSGGALTEAAYDGYLERAFRITNNTANEKLVLCGSGFLSVINQMYKSKTNLTSDLPLQDTYGMNVVKHVTPFGTIFYKTHPLFSQNPNLRYNALFLDVHNLVYRYIQGRDTELLKGREPNDADYRKDEWLTECGLEVHYPESHLYLKNVTSYTP